MLQILQTYTNTNLYCFSSFPPPLKYSFTVGKQTLPRLKDACLIFLLQKTLSIDATMMIHFKRGRWMFLV